MSDSGFKPIEQGSEGSAKPRLETLEEARESIAKFVETNREILEWMAEN